MRSSAETDLATLLAHDFPWTTSASQASTRSPGRSSCNTSRTCAACERSFSRFDCMAAGRSPAIINLWRANRAASGGSRNDPAIDHCRPHGRFDEVIEEPQGLRCSGEPRQAHRARLGSGGRSQKEFDPQALPPHLKRGGRTPGSRPGTGRKPISRLARADGKSALMPGTAIFELGSEPRHPEFWKRRSSGFRGDSRAR